MKAKNRILKEMRMKNQKRNKKKKINTVPETSIKMNSRILESKRGVCGERGREKQTEIGRVGGRRNRKGKRGRKKREERSGEKNISR